RPAITTAEEPGGVKNKPGATTAEVSARPKNGPTQSSFSFKVTGTVRTQDGRVQKRQRLLAFDLDLRAVGAYRDVRILSEVEKNRGFEFLGEAISDVRGNYEIQFYDWQYRRAERKKADIMIFAVQSSDDGERIVGCSQMVNAEEYSDKGLARGVDVIITE